MSARVGILISGRGSNMVALVQAMIAGEVEAEPVLIVCNVPGAPGLEKAAALGVPTAVADHRDFPSREDHDRRLVELFREAEADWICLAGYMRMLSPGFLAAFKDRILNIHPALLPSFPGLQAQQRALEWGVKVTGVTVHFVDEELDHGPILVQRPVEVREEDTVEDLEARILETEHKAYPEALALAVSGRVRIEGRRARVDPPGPSVK